MSEAATRPVVEAEVFLTIYHTDYDKEQTVKDAKADWRSHLDLASAAGVNVNALKLAKKVLKMEPREAQVYMRDALLYLKFLGQDLLDYREIMDNSAAMSLTAAVQATHAIWTAEKQGYEDGKAGNPIDNNPYLGGTDTYQAYASEWLNGSQERKAREGGGSE